MAARGLKRICGECSTRFYDLNKSPIICPACGAEFSGLAKVKSRRSRNTVEDKPKPEAEAENDNQVTEDNEGDNISLDELADSEDSDDNDEDMDLDNLDDIDDVDSDDDLDDLDEDLNVDIDKDDR